MPTTTCASLPVAAHRLPSSKVSVALDAGAMIVSCPACRTRYLVDATALAGADGRTVRCANCGHSWHQAPPPPLEDERFEGSRLEPALEVPPRPGQAAGPTLKRPPSRPGPVPRTPLHGRRSRWAMLRWLVPVLLALAILAGILVARGALVTTWPSAERFYGLLGWPVEPPGAGLKIEKLVPTRTPDGLIIEGDVSNSTKTARDVPRLRVALRDAAEKEVQFKIIDPPKPRLPPGAVAHFKTPFEHPEDAAIGVVVTFVAR